MNAIKEAIARFLRGPRVAGLLRSFGIDPRCYWLLMDLFDLLSERGEVLDQLGRDGVALKTVSRIYFAMSSLLSLVLVATGTGLATYSGTFLLLTAFILISVLVSETGNSLVNPVEGLVLAHQPITGATYTAAKLTHLVRIVLYMVPGMNAVPALAGLALKGSVWYFPLVHLLAALAVGLVAGLLCCALFGWLIRFVPPRRLKAAGQLAAALPFFGVVWFPEIRKWFAHSNVLHWLPPQAAARWGLGLAFGVAAAAIVTLGIRSLSADYLIRVSSMMRGGSALGAKTRRLGMGETFAWFFAGQAGRAGFAFVYRMMLRDWQFRRQILPLMIYALVGLVPAVAGGWRTDPFSGRFTSMHVLPHAFGIAVFFICNMLPYGSDYKGAWIFLLAPSRAFHPFASGIYALLWLGIAVPHAIILPWLIWSWGIWHAGLFVAYSVAVCSIYIALELRLIDGVPFTKQVDASRGAEMLPMMIAGSVVVALAVGLQYLLVFRSPAVVLLTAVASGAAAFFLTRSSVAALEVSIRYNLGLLSAETGTLYKEVG